LRQRRLTACCASCGSRFERASTGRRRRFCSDACRVAAWRRRRRRSVHFRSETDEWATPQEVFDELDREFGFDLDPCATHENAKCARYFTRADDGLVQEWRGLVFMNPPYGPAIAAWMRKAWEASQTTAELVVCLVPARTDTAWWHDYAARGDVRYLRGRLSFNGHGTAPFPSCVVVFRNASRVTERGLST
jgi:phage N-6-adenine-methyltransferase